MTKKFTEDNLREIINKQFEINGYLSTYDEVKKDKKWLEKYETNKKLESEFMEWLIVYIKPYTINSRIEKEVWHFILNYWLPRKDYE